MSRKQPASAAAATTAGTGNSAAPDPVRTRIVAGARKHFFSLGFRGVTMDDLAKELGMSKKTLYAHFQSKVELLQAVMLDKFADVERDLEKVTSTAALTTDFMEVLHDLLTTLQGHTGEIQPAYVRDVQREMPELFGLVLQRRQELIQRYFSKVLSAGRKAGMIRQDIALEFMIAVLLGATESVVNPKKMTEFGLTPKEGLSAVLNIFLEGVITRKGES